MPSFKLSSVGSSTAIQNKLFEIKFYEGEFVKFIICGKKYFTLITAKINFK